MPQAMTFRGFSEWPYQSDKISSDIGMGDRYGRSDINQMSMGMSIWDMV
jgi:hypothetical protein